MKKFNLISSIAIALTIAMNIASAAETGGNPSCSYERYQNKIDGIMDLTRNEIIATMVPVVAGSTIAYVGFSGENAEIGILGFAIAGVGGLEFGGFYVIKEVEARHFKEALNNILGAEGKKDSAKALEHTTHLIDKKARATYTEDQVAHAIVAAANAGAFCGADGTLAVTDHFREIVESYIARD